MKYFFLIQITISILLAGSLFLSYDSSPTKTSMFADKITTIQSSREKFIRYYKKKPNASKHKKKSIRNLQEKNKLQNNQRDSGRSQLEIVIIDAGLDPDLLSIWLPHKQLSAIHYRRAGQEPLIIKNPSFRGSGKQTKVLQLSSQDAIDEIKDLRNDSFNNSNKNDDGKDDDKYADLQKLSAKSFKVISFTPGKQDNGDPIKPPKSFSFSLQGPDHDNNQEIDHTNIAELEKLRQKTISFGHGGEIVLQVTQEGILLNDKGPDFAIYENPQTDSPEFIYQEFAYVGVAEENKPDAYKWFPCHPQKSILTGCAGVVATDDGGDLFDLSTVGVDRIRFIKIKDTGTNLSNFAKNTEGFDLDSLKLIYPYKELPTAEDELEK